jgi:hypothetical protein
MVCSKLYHESSFQAVMAAIPSSILSLDERLAVLMVNRNLLGKSRGGTMRVITGTTQVIPGD